MVKAVDDGVQEYIKSLEIPENITKVISRLNFDLYFGPLYLVDFNPEDLTSGDDASCFDEGAVQFPFVKAGKVVRDFLDDKVEDIYVDEDSGCYSLTEPEGEEDEETGEYIEPGTYYHVEAKEIIAEILGDELARTI